MYLKKATSSELFKIIEDIAKVTRASDDRQRLETIYSY